MTNLNFSPGTVFHMDNLEALRGMNSNTVDLIATDPPFNTGRNREGKGGQYPDQWRWGDNVHYEWMDQIRDDNEPLVEVIESAMHAHSFNLGAFLCFMGVRNTPPIAAVEAAAGDEAGAQGDGEHLPVLRSHGEPLPQGEYGRRVWWCRMFPAGTGMNRENQANHRNQRHVPRRRGDEPTPAGDRYV